MISRNSAKTIADAYYSNFIHFHRGTRVYSGRFTTDLHSLYDFLYVNDFEAWLLNAFNSLSSTNTRDLIDFILRIHTGESLSVATPQWNWQQRQTLGQRILKELAECLIRKQLSSDPDFQSSEDSAKRSVAIMQRTLELDGYIFRDNILWIPEESVVNEAEEQGVLESLMNSLGLPDVPTLKHHLELSATDYQASHWDNSISNSRKVLDGVLTQVAIRYSDISGDSGLSSKELERAFAVRDYLEQIKLLEKKEKEAIASVYALLSDTGGHPYIAERDQARLMRHLSLTLSQFVLLRLEGIIHARTK
jgi:hypothetical protein